MFLYKMLRDRLFLNVLLRSNGKISSLAGVSKILDDNQRLPKQCMSNRYMHNYKRNWDNQSPDKISRTVICHKYLRFIKNSVRDSGPVLELNPKLAYLIENAKKNNLSPEFINFAIKISGDVRAKFGLYDILLPNGCHFLVQYEDIDTTTTKYHLLTLCEKYDGTLIQDETVWPKSFVQKGVVLLKHKNSDPFSNLSKERISEMGVQSFHKETDIEGVKYWKFYCDPWQLPEVKQQLCQISNSIDEAYVGYFPKRKNIPSQYVRNNILNIFIKLCEVPTIDNVYTNTNIVQ